jgi:hypothetical protein
MILSDTATIKPEVKKVNFAAKPNNAGRAQIRIAEEARAARARIDQAECNKTLQAFLVEQIADVHQMTEEEIGEIGASWEGLCDLAAEAGISEAGRERRQKATHDFATANPCRLLAFAEYFAREYPDGAPPPSGATEAERQMILDSIVRHTRGGTIDPPRPRRGFRFPARWRRRSWPQAEAIQPSLTATLTETAK